MILNRKFYNKRSWFSSGWNTFQMRKLRGEKLFKVFQLQKSEPGKSYFYSPRLKRIPRFTGDTRLLTSWPDAKLLEVMCPTNAIKVTADAVLIDSRGCITCGLCVEMSPPGLLEMPAELEVEEKKTEAI